MNVVSYGGGHISAVADMHGFFHRVRRGDISCGGEAVAYVIPAIFLAVFIAAAVKKVKIYDEFSAGIGEAVKFTMNLLPFLAAVFMMCELFEVSTLSDRLTALLSPVFSALGIPSELVKLVLIKPFSGSGSLAYLSKIISENGADSYVARCAAVCYGSSETMFYISAVYFAGLKKKRLAASMAIVAASTLLSTVLACFICKFM